MQNIKNSEFKERLGWYFYDWANSAFTTTVITVFLGPYLNVIARNAADAEGLIYPLGLPIYAESLFGYVISLSVLLQVIVLPIIGAIADFTRLKKQLLGVFAYIGSFATMGMYFLEGDSYALGAVLLLISNLSFGASIVMYNAFLSDLAEEERRDAVSSVGWAFGYLGAGLMLLLNLILYSNADEFGIDSGFAVRISLCSAGVWWALFTVIPMLLLKVRIPAKTLPKGESYLSNGFKTLYQTFKNAKHYPKTLWFLAAYIFYNDGVQAVITFAAVFGAEELKLEQSSLISAILLVQFVAFFGAIGFNYIAKWLGTKEAILLSLIIWIICVVYAYGWLETEFEFYLLAVGIAFVLGGTQALSRSLFSKMIPNGKEAEYFSLYEISERGTSWLGSFVFALSLQLTHSYRFAILSLIAFFVIGLILLLKTDVLEAIKESKIHHNS